MGYIFYKASKGDAGCILGDEQDTHSLITAFDSLDSPSFLNSDSP